MFENVFRMNEKRITKGLKWNFFLCVMLLLRGSSERVENYNKVVDWKWPLGRILTAKTDSSSRLTDYFTAHQVSAWDKAMMMMMDSFELKRCFTMGFYHQVIKNLFEIHLLTELLDSDCFRGHWDIARHASSFQCSKSNSPEEIHNKSLEGKLITSSWND